MSPHLQTMLQQAINHTQQNNFSQAKLLFNYILKIQPKNFDALHAMGFICGVENNHQEASCYLIRAIKINSNVLEVNMNCAKSLQEVGNYLDSIKYFQQAIFLSPNNHEVWLGCGRSFKSLRRFDEAIAHYDKALGLNPNYAEAWSNKGNTLHELKRYEEAIAHYDKALSLKPDYADVWSNKGVTLHELKRFDEAIAHYDKALSLNPNYAKAWSNKGVTFQGLKRFDEAIAYYDEALSLKPDYAVGWSNKGNTLHELNRFDEAIAHYDKAISLMPDYHNAWTNKGNALRELKRFDEAIAHYEKALTLRPDIDWVSGSLRNTKMTICSWSGLSESLEDFFKKVMANEKVVAPFSLLALNDDALLHKKCSEIYIQSRYPFNPVLESIVKRPQSQKIRVGYFSADFKNHPVAYLIGELIELHDRSQFEIYGFSLVKAVDEMSRRFKLVFDHSIESQGMSDIEIAQFSRDLNIDIAVDLTGFTKDSRMGIFSYRAAPIQVNYLGYPGTMGADYIDYIIADKTLIPLDAQSSYTEKVVYLPNSYQVNDRKRLISDRQFTRHELGLPEDEFVFCCFNNNFKILPVTFASWMRILKAVEGSVLWLFRDNPWAVVNLKKEAEKQGISADRLLFAERLPLPEHLARHRQADLFLDTLPYNAHTTASDALWAGLPVLTLMGNTFPGRVGASLLKAIDLPELITNTQEEYEAMAIELAMNPQKLRDIKLKLARNRLATPLFDTPLFTKNHETIYIKMKERYQADLQPDHITIN
jgi:protein O-GlcNAc transferase